jgi:hypothetical protein
MRNRETSIGEVSGRRRAAVIGLAGAAALTLAACTSGSTSAKAPVPRATATAPPAEGCIGITAADYGRPPIEGTTYAFTLIGRWGAGTRPIGEQLTITVETSAGPGAPDTQPLVPAKPDGSLPEPLTYEFPAAEAVTKYAVQGTIVLAHGARTFSPVTPFCKTDVTVPAAPYQQAPEEGTVTVRN